MRRVAFLHPYLENDNEVLTRVIAFREGLEALGWIENRNIRIEHRYTGGDLGRIRAYATELVHSAPDLIVGSGTPITAALKEATRTIPIVFNLVNDPVGQGFVASLSRPGGNITGFTFINPALIGKWIGLLGELQPGVTRTALLFNPATAPFYRNFLPEIEAARRPGAASMVPMPITAAAELAPAITDFAKTPGGGLLIGPDPFTIVHIKEVTQLVQQARLPAISVYRPFPAEGGLMAYGPDTADIFRRSAAYIDRVLKGANPAELPVQEPDKFEFIVNLKAASALGIDLPRTLLATADEVIE